MAERLYSESKVESPDELDPLQLRGLLAFKLGDRRRAIALIKKAIKARPDFAEALNNLAVVLFADGAPDEAEAALRRAIEIKSGGVWPTSRRGTGSRRGP